MARNKRQNDAFLASVWILVFCELEDYWIHGRERSPKTVLDACRVIIKRRPTKQIDVDQSIKSSGEGSIFSISHPETLRDWFYEAEKLRHDPENHEFLFERTRLFDNRYEAIKLMQEARVVADKTDKLLVPKRPRGRPSTKDGGTKTTKKVEIKPLDWNK